MLALRHALLLVGLDIVRLGHSAPICWQELQNLHALKSLFCNPWQLSESCFGLVQCIQIFNSLHFLILSSQVRKLGQYKLE